MGELILLIVCMPWAAMQPSSLSEWLSQNWQILAVFGAGAGAWADVRVKLALLTQGQVHQRDGLLEVKNSIESLKANLFDVRTREEAQKGL